MMKEKIGLLIISLFVAFLLWGSESVYAQTTYVENEDPGYWKGNGYYQEEDNVSISMDFKYATQDTIKHGIDVSKWNGAIDWNRAKDNGVQFAIIRVGYRGYENGTLAEDPYYKQNIEGAIAAGIPVGVYFFSQAVTEEEAIEEANYIIERILPYKISLPVVIDYEYTGSNGTDGRLYEANLSKEVATNVCRAFLQTVENAGYTAMLYANIYMLSSKLNASELEKDYYIWLAHYTQSTDYQGQYDFWQYTSKGNGYQYGMSSQYVDLNYWYDDGTIGNSVVYNISYTLNGGENNSENPAIYNSNSSVILKNPSRKGYTFGGWYSDAELTSKVSEISKGSTGDKTLYAKWMPNLFSIAFHANGGSGSMKTMENRVYDKTYTLPANSFYRTGYKFIGWNTKADGSGKFYWDKGKIKNSTSKNRATLTFYAQWEKIEYTVNYELNGGINHKDNPTVYDITTTRKLNNPSRKGYIFEGWYSDAKFTNKVSEISKGSTGNKTLYAKWGNIPTLAKPHKITNVVKGVHVYWTAEENVTKYGVWRSETGENGTYKWLANPTVDHYTDTNVESGKTYYYKVTACDGTAKVHGEKSEAIGIVYINTPDITSRVNKAAGIQLGWNKVEGATGYAIYRKSGNQDWVKMATISGNDTFTWIDKTIKNSNGNVYKYTIRALGGSDMKTLSGCRNTGRTMVRLSSRVLNSATKASTTSIKCKWTTSSAVTGYEVRFMVGEEIYKIVTVGNYETGTKTFTGLKTGQTYKVQVRSYKKVNGVGTFYSAWSTEKNVTLK